MKQFSTIKGLSNERRLPRLGKIRLGIKKMSKGGKPYPAEVDYFVCPPEVEKFYGEKPTKLDVMVPVEEIAAIMPTAYKSYKKSGLYCIGDGESAVRRNDKGAMVERECPCELLTQDRPECKRTAVLNVILPKINLGGVYQIVTGSWNSIVDCQSGLDYVRAMIGRVSWVPMHLERIPIDTSHTDPKTGQMSKQTHYTLRLTFEGDVDFVNRLRMESEAILSGPRYRLPVIESDPVADLPALGLDDEPQDGDAPEVFDAEPVTSDEGADAQPITAADNAPLPPAPTPPPPPPAKKAKPAKATEALATKEHIAALWDAFKTVFGPRAKAGFKFFVTEFCGKEASSEVAAGVAVEHCNRLRSIDGLGGDATAQAAEDYTKELKSVVAERKASRGA
ncbi:MAG TPA: hypothetical protein VFH61_06375 [Thermoleophilia bacterium]|nr:hypothetical protein [Thermoleophilia bacterium]